MPERKLFGLFGDALGRHRVYGKELMLTLFGTMMVILMPWGDISHQSVVAWMAVFRVVTGCGTGGGTMSARFNKTIPDTRQTIR